MYYVSNQQFILVILPFRGVEDINTYTVFKRALFWYQNWSVKISCPDPAPN